MILSFSYRKVRILQSYFDQGSLVILKSLRLFHAQDLERNVDLFMLYASSTCVGDTKAVKTDWLMRYQQQD